MAAVEDKCGRDVLLEKIQRLEMRLERANRALSAQEAVFDAIPLFMMVVDGQLRVKRVSRTVAGFTGLAVDSHARLKTGDVLKCRNPIENQDGCGKGPACRTCRIREIIEATFETKDSFSRVSIRLPGVHSAAPPRHLLLSTALLKGSPPAVLIFIEDNTEQKAAEARLRKQKEFFNTLIEGIANPIFHKDAAGRYTGCNKAFERFLGKTRSEIIGRTVFDMGPGDIAQKYFEKDAQLLSNGGEQRYEWKVMRSDGEVRDVIFDKASLHDPAGNITGLVGVISDITDRKHAEELVRHLSRILMQAQERERQMIAFELHDGIAQNLSTLKLYCNRMHARRPPADTWEEACFTNVKDLIDKTITEVRDLSYNLRPASLDHLGMVDALKTHCEEFSEKSRITVDFQAAGVHESMLGPELKINLYRLALEGLNNIEKHAGATRVVVRLVGAFPNIILRIKDNGQGFDMERREGEAIREKRMGLRIMKERVRLLRGRISIRSLPRKGTMIAVTLPIGEIANGTG